MNTKLFEIKTERLYIRTLTQEDWCGMRKIFADFNKSEYAAYDMPLPEDEDGAKALVKRFAESNLFFAVFLQGESEMMGYVCFHKSENEYDLGYCFHSEYHSKGYAHESTNALIKYMRNVHNAVLFTAGTALDNTPSCKLLEKLGFELVSEETVSFDGRFSFRGGNYRLCVSNELATHSVYPNCRVIDIYGDNYSGATRRIREASRAIIVKDGSILLSHEKNIGQWMTPGGGCEANETPADCCIRETAEETGLVVMPEKCFLVINEYYEDVKYVSYYFECSVTGETERKPTEREIQVGAEPEWVSFDLATDIFSHHRNFAESNEERRGIYLKEYTALTEFAK